MTRGLGRRVVFVLESPLSDRDADRLGLRTLQSLGFNVVAWDLSMIYLPRSTKADREEVTDVPVNRWMTLDDVNLACESLTREDIVMSFVGTYRGQLKTHLKLLKAFSRSPARIGTVSAGHLPAALTDIDTARRSYQQSNASVPDRLVIAVQRVEVAIRTKLRPLRATWIRRLHRLRRLDFVWAGTNTDDIEPSLLGRRTQIHMIHALDYDRIQPVLRDLDSDSLDLVLIDSMGPLHPDYSTLGEIVPGLSSEAYFASLRVALNDIEEASGLKVTVAAHPRAIPGQLEAAYGDRPIVYQDTAQCVAQARAVLLTSPSTALSLVTFMRKPALVITSHHFDPYLKVALPRLAQMLSLPTWNTEDPPGEWREPIIDSGAYAAYVLQYVKRPGTTEQPFWNVVGNDLSAIRDS